MTRLFIAVVLALCLCSAALALPQRAILDFDGDNKSDIVLMREVVIPPGPASDYYWYVLKSTGGYTQTQYGGRPSINPFIYGRPIPGDYDGDHKWDIAVGGDGGIGFLQSSTNTIVSKPWGYLADHSFITQDFDSDGKTDLAVTRNVGGGQLNWIVSLSGNGNFLLTSFGTTDDDLVRGDFNGDGKADCAVYHRTSTLIGNYFQVRFTGGPSDATYYWGHNDDQPVAGDYDGDGKTDYAIYRPSQGAWYWARSGSSGYQSVVFGQAGDRPMPADYDGDGKMDPAVYRSSGGLGYIYILGSATGFSAVQFGLPGDLPLAYQLVTNYF